jgi:hypothetical protein
MLTQLTYWLGPWLMPMELWYWDHQILGVQARKVQCGSLNLGPKSMVPNQPIQSIFTLRASHQKCTLARSEHASKSRPIVCRVYGPASHSKRVGWVPCFKCTGQQVSILAHGPVPLLQVVWPVHIYIWMGASKWTKIAQPGVRSKRLGQPHVQSVWAECHLSSALTSGSPYSDEHSPASSRGPGQARPD